MNTIVIYTSQTGFTEQYAKWTAEELNCKCLSQKEVTASMLSGYSRVVYGGWVMGNMVFGLDKLLKIVSPTAVFAVGSTPISDEVVCQIREQNKLGDTPLFYMTGGFRFDKLSFIQRTLLKTLKKSVAKKENKSSQDQFMADKLGTSFDNSSREQILPLISALQNATGGCR